MLKVVLTSVTIAVFGLAVSAQVKPDTTSSPPPTQQSASQQKPQTAPQTSGSGSSQVRRLPTNWSKIKDLFM